LRTLKNLDQATDTLGSQDGFALSWIISINTTYLTLVRPGQAATLVALYSLLRNSAAALGAVIIDPLVKAEGFGWCFTGLAIVDLLSTLIAVVSLLKGRRWRKQLEDKVEDKGKAKETTGGGEDIEGR
jgi:CTD nuclear envelope phosphatase 1